MLYREYDNSSALEGGVGRAVQVEAKPRMPPWQIPCRELGDGSVPTAMWGGVQRLETSPRMVRCCTSKSCGEQAQWRNQVGITEYWVSL